MDDDMKNLVKSVDTIAKTVAVILDTMATKTDLESFKLETHTHFNNLETDLKSFKYETRERFDSIDEKLADFLDTVMNHDKRIAVLEEQVV